jgi:hypothetical protein
MGCFVATRSNPIPTLSLPLKGRELKVLPTRKAWAFPVTQTIDHHDSSFFEGREINQTSKYKHNNRLPSGDQKIQLKSIFATIPSNKASRDTRLPRLQGSPLPLQGGGREGDGVLCRYSVKPHPHPIPPLEGEGAVMVERPPATRLYSCDRRIGQNFLSPRA